jgi:hypothetical protein
MACSPDILFSLLHSGYKAQPFNGQTTGARDDFCSWHELFAQEQIVCTRYIYKAKMNDKAGCSDFIRVMARPFSIRQPARARPGLWLQRPHCFGSTVLPIGACSTDSRGTYTRASTTLATRLPGGSYGEL